MKRIQSACLEQTNRFETEDDYKTYMKTLKRKGTKYKIISEEKMADNSIIVKVKLQYLNYEVGSYMD